MSGLINKFVVGASVVVGMSAVVAPAQAAFQINGSDYILYNSNNTNTYAAPSADVNELLMGDSKNPGGNIELFASSENPSSSWKEATSIEGSYKGKDLTISSLTDTDWFGADLNTSYGEDNFANTYFNAFFDAAVKSSVKSMLTTIGQLSSTKANLYNVFLGNNLFQASSDPNISYITDNGSDLMLGLAGHMNLKTQYSSKLQGFADYLNDNFQFSEAVKVNYGGVEQLLFGTVATATGLKEVSDGVSHNGNYEVSLQGVIEKPPAAVPEPSTMLGLMAVGGLFAAAKRNSKKA
ncbi:NF038130 family PEP-CTERM protein [Limnoraphis robusta]|uniref:NF038130 family PEP-CTERM protein n=1 Tax=Limnoraphis robusta CCNP1315 TaxID=3110306 RepID=A0ABU5U568_9CYAN|nr:NF038130 family PEP-CTERM protein [Limnoraphis robusta]MEA5522042.1 NF038130 family PEP-CTERM protein [Limnoraphis robusta CCNP1315]MEA5545416.1 NF038130 family PEP-CTERM protein [Limnoraphis robusta CCNP1324]